MKILIFISQICSEIAEIWLEVLFADQREKLICGYMDNYIIRIFQVGKDPQGSSPALK